MSDVYRMLLDLHVLAAGVAIPTFWGAMLARKGGRLHLRCGRTFAVSMAITAGVAAVLCLLLLADPLAARPPGPEEADLGEYARILRELGGGLLEVSLATGALLHFGLRALRRRGARTSRSGDLAVAAATAAAGVGLLALGFDPARPWFEGRGIFLGLVGALELRALLRSERSRSAWLVEHLVGMMGSGGIAHGALSVNLAGLFTDDLGEMFAAAGPIVILFGVGIGWTARRWRRRLEGAPERLRQRSSHSLAIPPGASRA